MLSPNYAYSSQCIKDAILKTNFSSSDSTNTHHFEIKRNKNFLGRGTTPDPSITSLPQHLALVPRSCALGAHHYAPVMQSQKMATITCNHVCKIWMQNDDTLK
jgi:hypothetical protein